MRRDAAARRLILVHLGGLSAPPAGSRYNATLQNKIKQLRVNSQNTKYKKTLLSMMTFLSGHRNRFSKLLYRIWFGKKSGSFNEQRGHAICLTVASRIDDSQVRGKFNSFPS